MKEEKEKRREAGNKLHEKFKETTDCKFVEIRKNGVGCAMLVDDDDAQGALGTLASAKFRGKVEVGCVGKNVRLDRLDT